MVGRRSTRCWEICQIRVPSYREHIPAEKNEITCAFGQERLARILLQEPQKASPRTADPPLATCTFETFASLWNFLREGRLSRMVLASRSQTPESLPLILEKPEWASATSGHATCMWKAQVIRNCDQQDKLKHTLSSLAESIHPSIHLFIRLSLAFLFTDCFSQDMKD